MEMHLAAAQFLDRTAAKAWDKIRESLVRGEKINEYQVRQFIAQEIDAHGFTTEALPICAVNAHSADPHFEPLKVGSAEIKRGDLILIDLWCKKKHPKAIYGDITRMGIADSAPKEKEKQVFDIVRKAQKAAMHLVEQRYSQGKQLTGYEVDATCRKVIEESGYGAYFTHRTGHNIYTEDHGPGAHIDSLETLDKRPLLPHTCFSIEPGIYLPNEFGVRLEHDVYLGDQGKALVTGGSQDAFTLLF
jgi:Xaa-Pro aminopeptidase